VQQLKTTQSKDYYSPAELSAAGLGDENTLAKWRMFGKGPRFIRINRRMIRYRRADVEAWLASLTQETTP
jgi:hypothetical protein